MCKVCNKSFAIILAFRTHSLSSCAKGMKHMDKMKKIQEDKKSPHSSFTKTLHTTFQVKLTSNQAHLIVQIQMCKSLMCTLTGCLHSWNSWKKVCFFNTIMEIMEIMEKSWKLGKIHGKHHGKHHGNHGKWISVKI